MDYPAKVILFGEYGMILNSKALAMPYSKYSGTFKISSKSADQRTPREIESNIALNQLNSFFKANREKFDFLNISQFEQDIARGLHFKSTIPSGSGLGSSGALTAAIYNDYQLQGSGEELFIVKSKLAAIESCIHGISSGIDPLICWLNKPFVLEDQSTINTGIDLSPFFENYSLYLINSNSKGNTSDFVSHFMKSYQDKEFKNNIDLTYIPLINQTIDALLVADFTTFDTLLENYSLFQLTNLRKMIPDNMVTHFKSGLESRNFKLKICGSGGGGYMIAIAKDRDKAESYFSLNHLEYTIVN
jgi:mevalonate kinase